MELQRERIGVLPKRRRNIIVVVVEVAVVTALLRPHRTVAANDDDDDADGIIDDRNVDTVPMSRFLTSKDGRNKWMVIVVETMSVKMRCVGVIQILNTLNRQFIEFF